FPPDIIDKLLKIKWWRYNPYDFKVKGDIDIESFISYIEDWIASGELRPYTPKKLKLKDFLV
ncbi:MAG: hypothetical protein LBH47_01175, partial [Christensenellaceae bacterium]|nr:hypothetical protein [Christensenellaceae bacterium]